MSEPARIPIVARDGDSAAGAAARLRAATADSIIAGLEPFEWDQDAAIAYEVAVDTIAMVIGAYSGMIAAEERRGAPDQALLREWEDAITRATRDEQALPVDERAEVERTTVAYTAELRRLRQLADA
ncbi:MAG: hypothetical protein ACT4PP_08095 [Sporichthyaceae bacterium]